VTNENTNNLFKKIQAGADFGQVLEIADQKIDFSLCNSDGYNLLTFAIKNKNLAAADALLVAGLSLDAKDLNNVNGRALMEKGGKEFQTLLEQYINSEEEKDGNSLSKDFIDFCNSYGDSFLKDSQYANRYPFEDMIEGTRVKRFQFGLTWQEIGEDEFEDTLIKELGISKWESRFDLFGADFQAVKKTIVIAHIQDTAYPSFEIKSDFELYADLDFHSKNIAGILSFDIVPHEELKAHMAELFYTDCQPIGIAFCDSTAFANSKFKYTKKSKTSDWEVKKPFRIQ
jgi:hypothetical protein